MYLGLPFVSRYILPMYSPLMPRQISCTPPTKQTMQVVLAGVEDPNSWADLEPPEEFIGRLRAEFPDDYVVLLGHRNYWMEKYPELPVQLILCGHAHGGIVRIPGIGGLLGTDRTLFPDYEAGKYDNGRYTMIVSRGIGNSVALPRAFNRPEIVSIILKN